MGVWSSHIHTRWPRYPALQEEPRLTSFPKFMLLGPEPRPRAFAKHVVALILLTAVSPSIAAAWNNVYHQAMDGNEVVSQESQAGAHACDELATFRVSVDQQVRDACEGLPDSAKVTVTQTLTGCSGSTSIEQGAVTVDSGSLICGDLRSP